MIESSAKSRTGSVLSRFRSLLDELDQSDLTSSAYPAADLIEMIGALEEFKCRLGGAQVMATVAFDTTQRAAQAAAGVPVDRQGLGVGLQVALARRESHHLGQQHLGLARTLVAELPCTLAALRGGRTTEWRATLVARETACLTREHRATIDQQLGDTPVAHALGVARLVGQLQRAANQLDPAAVVNRRRRAETERCVTLRPAPDTMTYLTALLPVTQGVGVFAALLRAADTARNDGDPRSRGQVMADLLVTRTLGQADGTHPHVPVTINVVVSDQTLLGNAPGSAEIHGYGPVPADLARDLARDLAGPAAGLALRRLYARPGDGTLVAMDSRSRCFPSGLAELIRLRDRTCRTPWCDAPIRHFDHIRPAAAGGPTTATNGQGLCEACNHAKQAPDWSQHVLDTRQHEVVTVTPTGATYRSGAPPCPPPATLTTPHTGDAETTTDTPRHPPARPPEPRSDPAWSLLEIELAQHLHAA